MGVVVRDEKAILDFCHSLNRVPPRCLMNPQWNTHTSTSWTWSRRWPQETATTSTLRRSSAKDTSWPDPSVRSSRRISFLRPRRRLPTATMRMMTRKRRSRGGPWTFPQKSLFPFLRLSLLWFVAAASECSQRGTLSPRSAFIWAYTCCAPCCAISTVGSHMYGIVHREFVPRCSHGGLLLWLWENIRSSNWVCCCWISRSSTDVNLWPVWKGSHWFSCQRVADVLFLEWAEIKVPQCYYRCCSVYTRFSFLMFLCCCLDFKETTNMSDQ